jgi:hypothetical protein
MISFAWVCLGLGGLLVIVGATTYNRNRAKAEGLPASLERGEYLARSRRGQNMVTLSLVFFTFSLAANIAEVALS